MKKMIVLIILILISTFSFGFEFLGLKSGMTREQVEKVINLENFTNYAKRDYINANYIPGRVEFKDHRNKTISTYKNKNYTNQIIRSPFEGVYLTFSEEYNYSSGELYQLKFKCKTGDNLTAISRLKALKTLFPEDVIKIKDNYYEVTLIDKKIMLKEIEKIEDNFLKYTKNN